MNRNGILKYFLIVSVIVCFITGCGNDNSQKLEVVKRYPNGNVELTQEVINDTLAAHNEYYENKALKSSYFIKDSLYHGYNKNYYENGKIKSEGNWCSGEKTGNFRYYDTFGRLNKIMEFITYQNPGKTMPNQLYRIGINGDTVLNGSSLYYEYYSVSDTIKNGVPYEFKIVLRGHILDRAHLKICNFDRYYNLLNEENCEGLDMENFEAHLILRKYQTGENVIRGVILNYSNAERMKGKGLGKFLNIYFTHKFYVVQ